jgi:L-alanine-DL-glutamate epimerase-like enolase superfamily enzyme
MKIIAIDTSVLQIPTRHQMPLQYPVHRMVAAQVRTDEGINGLGYSLLFNGTGDGPVRQYLDQHLKPLVTGQDPVAIDRLWTAMSQPQVPAAQRRAQAYAVAALDIALWDIAGQVAGLPLARLWGAQRTQVACYGSGGWATYQVSDLIAEAERYAALGCGYYKLKAHDPDPAVNRRRAQAVRAALGPPVRLMVDINQRGDVASNRRLAAELADLDLLWYEEPVPADDLAACAEVARSIPIPVATGENNLSCAEFAEIIERGAAHYLMPDVARAYGFSETLRIGRLAAAAGLPVAPHLVPELSAHVVAALPTGFVVEYMDWYPPDLFDDLPVPRAGLVDLPDRPGHGVSLRPGAVERYRVG